MDEDNVRNSEKPSWLGRFWQSLIEPSASIMDAETRIKSRWLSTILVVLVPFGILVGCIPPIIDRRPVLEDPQVIGIICLACLLVMSYLLSRQGYYQSGALLALGLANITVFTISLFDHDPDNVINDVSYLAAILLFSSLLLSQKYTFGLLILNTIGLLLIPNWAPNVSLGDIFKEPLSLLLTIYALVFTGTQLRKSLENHHLNGLRKEILERQNAEARLRASLVEKDVLLREIHHRVKNNLQIISSLLSLQTHSVEDPTTSDLFQDSQNRVRSMALVHERLYRSDNLTRIDFGSYLRDLTQHLLQTYRPYGDSILLNITVDDIVVNVDTAIPCGLLVNELVSNSLKHAFPNGEDGIITITMQQDDAGRYLLHILDNGIGISNPLSWRSTSSLGLQLVNSLAEQLGGVIDLHEGTGTHFSLSFGQ